MRRLIAVALAFALVVAVMAVLAEDVFAQAVGQSRELSPGRVRVNIGEIPSNVPGFDKVRVVEDTTRVGATYTATMPLPMFCTLLKGELSGTLNGVPTVRKAGDSWVCNVGDKVEQKSTGMEPSVMRMHHLIKSGQ